jgi:hypothetical protein
MDDPTDARAYEAPMGGATTPIYEPPPIAAAPAPSLTPAWPVHARSARAAGTHARRPDSPWRRALVVALVALLVLVGLGAGAWALAIRPAVHSRVDDALRSELANTISQVPPNVPPNEYAISAATINAHIDQNIPAGSGVSSAEIHFQNGDIVLRYTYQGSSGTVTTQLEPIGGRLVARNTSVTGVLGWVESGDEAQAALNAELPGMPSGYRITSVRTDNDTLIVRVNE